MFTIHFCASIFSKKMRVLFVFKVKKIVCGGTLINWPPKKKVLYMNVLFVCFLLYPSFIMYIDDSEFRVSLVFVVCF